jgi:predicted Fe-Mo cluster-binding NifX family protein
MNTVHTKNKLLAAIPVLKNEGLLSKVSRHFGKSPGFILINLHAEDFEYLDSKRIRKENECAPLSALDEKGCQVLFCHSMGKGALERCREAGLLIYQTQGGLTVSDVIATFRSGKRIELPDSALCHHDHDHCHPHSHGESHEH